MAACISFAKFNFQPLISSSFKNEELQQPRLTVHKFPGPLEHLSLSNNMVSRMMKKVTPTVSTPRRGPLIPQGSTTAVGETELDIVSRQSEIVPDTIIGDDFSSFPPTAASVSSSMLLGIAGLPEAKFDGAIESALAYGKCFVQEKGAGRMSCFVDKALVNVGAELAGMVSGRVSTEVDPRLAHSTAAITDKVRALAKLYNEIELPQSRILYRIPATWEGIEASRQLEDDGIQTHITQVYSFAQAAAAAQAGASVIQISLGRVRDWARTNSGDQTIDEAVSKGIDPGVDLVTRAFNYVFKLGHKSKVMASALRTKEDVFSLLGLDYLIVPVRILEALKESPAGPEGQYGVERKIASSSEEAQSYSREEMEPWNKERFEAEIGPCGSQLLASDLESATEQLLRVEEHFTKIWPPPNV